MRRTEPYHYNRRYRCNTIIFRGTVISTQKNRVVHTVISGGDSQLDASPDGGIHASTTPIKSSSETRTYHEFFLRNETSGKEEAIELEGWDLSLRSGHDVAVAWVADNAGERIAAVYNYTLGQETWAESALPEPFQYQKPALLITLNAMLWFLWLLASIAVALKFGFWRPLAALLVIAGLLIAVAMLSHFLNDIFNRERKRRQEAARADLRRTLRQRADAAARRRL